MKFPDELLAEVSLEEAGESLAVAGFVARHLVDGVVNRIEVRSLCALRKVKLAGSCAVLGLHAHLEVASAVRYVRETGVQYGCDPDRVFLIGFSAGGHLAASYGNFWNRPFVAEALGCDAARLRPNGQVLSYPVITAGPHAHEGSFECLLGDRCAAERESLSLENSVTQDTPPTFIWHTQPDDCVPVENALLFVSALQKAGVKTEFHMFPAGGHGLSLCDRVTSNSETQLLPKNAKWFDLAADFLWSL